jgi:hypothetical protein
VTLILRLADRFRELSKLIAPQDQQIALQRGFMLLPTLHLTPHGRRLEPQRLVALKHGEKLRNAHGRALRQAHRLAAKPHAATDTAPPANHHAVEQPQRPRLLTAARSDEPAPTPAVWEPSERHANGLFHVAETDDKFGRRGGDDAASAEARDVNEGQIVDEASFGAAGHKILDRSLVPALQALTRPSGRQSIAVMWIIGAVIRVV